MALLISNKGTGAGGCRTTLNGNEFENKTDNRCNLIDYKRVDIYKKSINGYYLIKSVSVNIDIIYITKKGLKYYLKQKYNIDDLDLFEPDEAYIIEPKNQKPTLKILEKKSQTQNGSVDIKLWAGSDIKKDYELALGHIFTVEYALCISSFLQDNFKTNKRYIRLKQTSDASNIKVFNGYDEDYFQKINKWINQS